ncbi:hypothetical protein BH23PLA1_BH23PLA1_14210 [soil metagenome]
MRRLSRIAFVLGLALLLTGDASACPNCKEAVAAQPEQAERLSQGYSYSILFMVAMPFALFGTGALMIARAVRKGGLPEM